MVGGGFDLTPYYGFDEDAISWHKTAETACKPFGNDIYPKYKKWCDEYFYLKHRDEQRGVGGLFFDDLNEMGFDQSFALCKVLVIILLRLTNRLFYEEEIMNMERKKEHFNSTEEVDMLNLIWSMIGVHYLGFRQVAEQNQF